MSCWRPTVRPCSWTSTWPSRRSGRTSRCRRQLGGTPQPHVPRTVGGHDGVTRGPADHVHRGMAAPTSTPWASCCMRCWGARSRSGSCPTLQMQFRRPLQVPVGLADIVDKCLAFDSRDRYPDAAQLAEDLRRHLANLPLRGVSNRSLTERWQKRRRCHPHALGRAVTTAVASSAVILVAGLVAGGDARQRLRGAALCWPKAATTWAAQRSPRGSACPLSWPGPYRPVLGPVTDRPPSRSQDLRRDLRQQLALAQPTQLAKELHDLANRLRFLYGTDLAATGALRALELHLRATWECAVEPKRTGEGLDPEIWRGGSGPISWTWGSFGRISASGWPRVVRPMRGGMPYESWMRPSDCSGRARPGRHQRRSLDAEALGLTDVALAATRCRAEAAPGTAWEHYALGRSRLAGRRLGGRRLGVRSGHRPSASRPVGPVLTGNLCLPPAMLRHRIDSPSMSASPCLPGLGSSADYKGAEPTRRWGTPIWPCATTTTPSALCLRWPSPC